MHTLPTTTSMKKRIYAISIGMALGLASVGDSRAMSTLIDLSFAPEWPATSSPGTVIVYNVTAVAREGFRQRPELPHVPPVRGERRNGVAQYASVLYLNAVPAEGRSDLVPMRCAVGKIIIVIVVSEDVKQVILKIG